VTVSIDDIRAAAKRLDGRIRSTPIVEASGEEFGVSGTVTLKLEFLQHSGSFKGRGAMHHMLANPIAEAGVVAASGGNHGGAVAWAAQELGHAANIFVPTISAPVKVERLRSYGATVHQVGNVYAEALAASTKMVAETGATAIHAYESPSVVAGAGTTGLELVDQFTGLGKAAPDAVLVACGGGGLAGGVAAALDSHTRVVACETTGTQAFAAARQAGSPVPVEVSGIAADALGATQIGDLAFELLQQQGAESVVVDDDAVRAAQRLMWERFRIITEPSAAVPIAALITGAFRPTENQHTVVIVCGANTDPGSILPAS